MEHAEDHVYGLQWHPEVCEPCRVHLTVLLCEDCLSSSFLEVINSKVGRKIVDRIFSLVGMLLTSPYTALAESCMQSADIAAGKRRTAPRGISDPPQGGAKVVGRTSNRRGFRKVSKLSLQRAWNQDAPTVVFSRSVFADAPLPLRSGLLH